MSFYSFARTVTVLAAKLCFHIRYEGLEHIPASGGFILACNHRSNTDPVLLANHIKPRVVHYLAKAELQKGPFFTWLFRALQIIPIHRGTGDTSAIEKAMDCVRQGHILGVFPEGTRSLDGKPLRPKSGLALIAQQTGADVLPAAISYEGGPKLRFRKKITVRFGEVIPNSAMGFTEAKKPSELKYASRLVMEKITEMIEG